MADERAQRKLTTILAADLEGCSSTPTAFVISLTGFDSMTFVSAITSASDPAGKGGGS